MLAVSTIHGGCTHGHGAVFLKTKISMKEDLLKNIFGILFWSLGRGWELGLQIDRYSKGKLQPLNNESTGSDSD